jgi:hypothetical protein
MEALIEHLLGAASNQWLGVVVLALYLVDRTGLVKAWLGGKASAREILSRDQQLLVENLREELERCGKDREDYEARLKARDERIELLIRGEARWRHLVNNLAQYIVALRFQLTKAGIAVPRFRGWDHFIADGGDAGENEYLAEISRDEAST